MAQWGDIDDAFRKPEKQKPVLEPSEFFATPKDQEELQEYILRFNGSERTAAMVCAMMAWNLACSIVNGTSEEADNSLEIRE